MKKQGGGRVCKIINACSTGHESYDLLGVYCVGKFSVRALTVAAAKEPVKHKITVNAYCPGVAGTKMWARIDAGMGKHLGLKPGEAFARFSAPVPEDVAALVHYLASPDSDYMTGRSLIIDGGMLCR